MGLIALLGHCALTLGQEEEEDKIQEWSSKIEEVECRMKTTIEACTAAFPRPSQIRRSATPAGEGRRKPAGHDSADSAALGEKVRLGELVGAAHQPLGQHLPQLASGGALPPRGRTELVRGAAGEQHQPGGVVQRQAAAGAQRLHPAGDGGSGEEGERPGGGGGAGEAAERVCCSRRQSPQGVCSCVELPRGMPLLGETQECGRVRAL